MTNEDKKALFLKTFNKESIEDDLKRLISLNLQPELIESFQKGTNFSGEVVDTYLDLLGAVKEA